MQKTVRRFILRDAFRIWNCGRIFGVGGAFRSMPVGGCTPDRNDPPTRKQRNRVQKTVRRFILRDAFRIWNCREIFSRDGAFRSMPVGGCTPDRNDPPTRGQGNRGQKTVRRFISGDAFQIWNCGRVFSVGGAFRSMPVGGCTPDRNDPPTRKQRNRGQKTVRRFILGDAFRIWNCGRVFSGGGSFRSGVQPPTGTRMDRHRPAQTVRLPARPPAREF